MPAVEHRRCQHVFERAERPVQVGVNERRMEGVEGSDPEHDVRRDPRQQQDDVDPDGSQEQVDRVEARRRNPVQLLGRMMDRVIFPEAGAVKHPVQPILHEVRQHQEQHRLQPQRQFGQGAVAVVVEGNQLVGVMNLEDHPGAEHQQSDPQHAAHQRHEEPVADIGDELALAPPWRAGIAGPEMGQHREHQRQRDRDGDHLGDRLAKHLDDFQGQIGHGRLI